jgi:hypothetical protein
MFISLIVYAYVTLKKINKLNKYYAFPGKPFIPSVHYFVVNYLFTLMSIANDSCSLRKKIVRPCTIHHSSRFYCVRAFILNYYYTERVYGYLSVFHHHHHHNFSIIAPIIFIFSIRLWIQHKETCFYVQINVFLKRLKLYMAIAYTPFSNPSTLVVVVSI